jgi:hypothetical protein
MRAMINEDDTKVALEFPDVVLTLTADELEEFIAVLMDIRSRMSPMPGEEPLMN